MFSKQVVQLIDAGIFQEESCILPNVNLTIKSGEFVYLIGKTGSGKTSLLKTLYGILPLKTGSGKVLEFDLAQLNRKKLPLLRRSVGFIFQDFVLLPDRTIEDNILFALSATGWKGDHRIKMRAQEVLVQVGILALAKKMPHQLSGGEQQRAVIARALINSPKLIIADEATGNLDPETSAEIVSILQQLSHKNGTAVLFATHDYQLIEQFPARVIRCDKGEIE